MLISWGMAFFEYCFQIPANRLGHAENGGLFSMVQLQLIQEIVSLIVFTLMHVLVFKKRELNWNHGLTLFFLFRLFTSYSESNPPLKQGD